LTDKKFADEEVYVNELKARLDGLGIGAGTQPKFPECLLDRATRSSANSI
jgi:hypothetical protein